MRNGFKTNKPKQRERERKLHSQKKRPNKACDATACGENNPIQSNPIQCVHLNDKVRTTIVRLCSNRNRRSLKQRGRKEGRRNKLPNKQQTVAFLRPVLQYLLTNELVAFHTCTHDVGPYPPRPHHMLTLVCNIAVAHTPACLLVLVRTCTWNESMSSI